MELAHLLAAASALAVCSCSLALNFDNSQIPKDAAPDGAYPAAECAFGEPNDSPAMATPVTAGMTGPAAICPAGSGAPDDQDYYQFTVPDGTASVTIEIDFQLTSDGDLDLKLFGSDGVTQLAQSRGFGSSEIITCPGDSPACAPLAAGAYDFLVFPAISGQNNAYEITLTIDAGSGSDSGSGSGSGSA